jgi:hypothetical protein
MEVIMATIHVKFQGTSRDIELSELFPDASSIDTLTDAAIKEATANHLDVSADEFESYVVERHANGNYTIHPQAEFGC